MRIANLFSYNNTTLRDFSATLSNGVQPVTGSICVNERDYFNISRTLYRDTNTRQFKNKSRDIFSNVIEYHT